MPGLDRAPILAVAALALAPCFLGAQGNAPVATGRPEDVGLSGPVLERIGPAMQELVDEGRTAGVMTLVARRGAVVHWETEGWRVLGEDPLEPDDIFRIYSMTKPVTSVAVMMLVEQGLLSLDTELADVIPEFRNQLVWDEGRLRPPARPILVRHLLTHTSGIGYGDIGRTPVDSLYREANLGVWGTAGDLEETVRRIASLPLIFDPGTRWSYSMSVDVLGRVVEVISGRALDDFFRTRIFEPLGMEDTEFWVADSKLDRFTAAYGPDPEGLRMIESPVNGQHTRPATWLSGGGGLTSTASDYLRFAQMLLNEGELEGVRLLRAETVRLMRTNQLPRGLMPISVSGYGEGFGLGFAVRTGEHAGAFGWLGIEGTYFWIDPTEQLVAFAWNQLRPAGAAPIYPTMSEIVYDALAQGAATAAAAPMIQPGAPGEPSRIVSDRSASGTDPVRPNEADVRFMRSMVPHHRQAVVMTELAEDRADSDAVRAMARRMQISQRDEIARIEAWLESHDQEFDPEGGDDMRPAPGMLSPEEMDQLAAAGGTTFDGLFLELMIRHHEGAITMVEALFASSGSAQLPEVFQLASDVEADQRMEIDRMRLQLRGGTP